MFISPIVPILRGALKGEKINLENKNILAKSHFNFPNKSPRNTLEKKLNFLSKGFSAINDYCESLGFSEDMTLDLLWRVWLPTVFYIKTKKQQKASAIIQGILGLQGTGKTTLATILRLLLTALGYQTIAISIDDLYKTYAERLELQKQDSRLIWRGPPGTHDVDLGIELLDNIRAGKAPVSIPRFDKSAWGGMGDRATPEIIEKPIDILLFEGWFLGVQPINPSSSYPPPIITEKDRAFAIDNNRRLEAYLPLWNRLDGLIILSPVDYRLSQQWRKEAEQKMINQGKSGMSEEEIERFVQYFWRALHPELFITPLIQRKQGVDGVIEIDANHLPTRIY